VEGRRLVWLYALTAFVLIDLVTVPFYGLLDHTAIRFHR
jgi:hypothetical protein